MVTLEMIKAAVRDVPDFPKPGILFKDITTVLKDPKLFAGVIDILCERYRDKGIDYVVGIESRGFIFASALAVRLDAGFVPIRKPGKLPCDTHKASYELEYGTDSIEIHKDAVEVNKTVLLIDDLLATGGTASAAVKLLETCGAKVQELAFLIELDFLAGRKKLGERAVYSMIHY